MAVACASISIGLIAVLGCKHSYGPDVVATVNAEPIQRSEVEKLYRENLGNNKEEPSKEQAEATRLGILKQLIDGEILQQAAKKMNLVASDEEVDAKQAEMKAPYTQEEWDKRLKAVNLSLDDLRREIRRNLTSEKLMNKEVNSRINITDADVSNFYNANKAQFNFIEPKYNIADIVVTSQPTPMRQGTNLQNNKANNDAEARKKIEMIHSHLESGEDFATMASNLSENTNDAGNGGNMGFVPESSLRNQPPPIFASIELNDPRVQQDIRQQLRDSRSQLLRAAYYEMLRNQTKVENHLAEQIFKNGAQ
jgi:peptidyl-prolyl cis-trans isomerase SurA